MINQYLQQNVRLISSVLLLWFVFQFSKLQINVFFILQKNQLFSTSENFSIDRYSFPKLTYEGIVIRFTGDITHLSISENKKWLIAGSRFLEFEVSWSQLFFFFFSDFDARIYDIEKKKQKSFLGHHAPILSAALDPLDEFLVNFFVF